MLVFSTHPDIYTKHWCKFIEGIKILWNFNQKNRSHGIKGGDKANKKRTVCQCRVYSIKCDEEETFQEQTYNVPVDRYFVLGDVRQQSRLQIYRNYKEKK